MKKYYVFVLLLLLTMSAYSQVRYYNAADFPLIGKISDNTPTIYERLPAEVLDTCRPPLVKLGQNTAGLAVRFRTNSTMVAAKWDLLNNNYMNHMTATGIKGLDLYAWKEGKWQFVNTARPANKSNEQTIIRNMVAQEREYLLFLPLYDGLVDLQIGIDSTAVMDKPLLPFPATTNPIVCYGTSITQGGCATRPGMAYTNILERILNREVINLGFSGNGQLDYEIADIMGRRTDAGLFILDFIPNVTLEQIREKTATFVQKLRRYNQEIPVLIVESIMFPHSEFDVISYQLITDKNNALREEYNKLCENGYENLYYLSAENLIGNDGETTVDGIHLTDLGFIRFATELEKSVRYIIK